MTAAERAPLRAAFITEGVHSHGALQARMARALEQDSAAEGRLATVAPPNRLEALLLRRAERLGDLDLHALRWRLRYSWRVRRLLRTAALHAEVALVNTQASALLAPLGKQDLPVVLSVDATGRQFARLEYWRRRDSFSPILESVLEALERRALTRAAAVVAWTEWNARSLREDYGVRADRLFIVHPGLPMSPPVQRLPRDTGSPIRVLFVGNGVGRKGLDVLVESLSRLDVRTELDVVTEDIVERGPHTRVHRGLEPGSDELAERFAQADIFALPTRADAVPWVVLEAMRAGLPVVATPVGAIPELVGEGGRLVPSGDAEALAAVIEELAGQPSLREELGRRNRRTVEQRYDAAVQFPRLLEVLRGAAAAQVPT